MRVVRTASKSEVLLKNCAILLRSGDISNEADVSFVKDPLNSTNKDPVLTVLYPAGAFDVPQTWSIYHARLDTMPSAKSVNTDDYSTLLIS